MLENRSTLPSEITRRRTFAIISHPDAGKTTLTEKFLLYGGAIQMAGQVRAKGEARRTRSDFMKMEQERGISVSASAMSFDFKYYRFNLVDTPGHSDFSEDTYRTLTAVDAAVMVIDGAKGVESQTQKLFEVCRMRDLPILTFCNKMDRESRNTFDIIDEIQENLAIDVSPASWPIGRGRDFIGTYDILRDRLELMDSADRNKISKSIKIKGLDDPALSEHVPADLLLIFDRSFGTSFYLSDIFISGEVLHYQGGSPVLFEHLFWFLGHPEVYIVLLPALGITSEIISTNARKPIFGYRAMIGSILAIAFLSTVVWGHHMFITGMNPFLGSVFTFTTLLIAIPSAVKTFNYITTLWKGNLQLNPAMLFSIGLVSTFVTGGLTGLVLGDSALDINIHDTYFVVAHFHLVMGVSAIFGMYAGIYHWFPKMYGRLMNKTLGYWHFWITIICAYGVFWPMHFIGLAGLPRRYYTNTNFPMFDDLADINVVITIFALVGGAAQLIFLANFFISMYRGEKATQNPWRSNTLEWTTPVAHVHGNWPGRLPEVHRWAYDYSKRLDANDDDSCLLYTSPSPRDS